MKVSVIIPTYNEEKVIQDCLESLLNQRYDDLEVIAIDDGSVDRTVEIINSLISNLQPPNLLLKQKHLGPGAARNLGAKCAKGEILVFVDADMTFDRDFVKKLIDPVIKGEATGTFSKEEYLANSDNVWARCWNLNKGLPVDRMHSKNYPGTQKVFRAILKKEFHKAGGFDEKAGYIDDWSLSDKLGVEAIAAPGAIFYHKNPDNLRDVFAQSKWMAKRRYKFGSMGSLIALVRVSLPVSIVIGSLYAVRYSLFPFLIFKIVSDFGQFLGILEYVVLGKASK